MNPDQDPNLPMPQPAAPSQPLPDNYMAPGTIPPPPKTGLSRRLKLLLAGLGSLLFAAAAAYGVLFYLPNRPENVYRTGLDRSGEALSKLTAKLTDQAALEQYQNTELSGTLDAKSATYRFSGDLVSRLSKTKSNTSLSVSLDAESSQQYELALKVLSDLREGKKFPDTHFQVKGIKSLGLDAFVPGISDYDGKWITVDADYIESLVEKSGSGQQKTQENITAQEAADLIKVAVDTTNEYVFTSDKDKAVLVNREFVGEEELEGRATYHYKVGFDKAHTKEFCRVIAARVLSHAAYKKLTRADDKTIEEEKKQADKECNESVDKDMKDDEVVDMWVDKQYKLIYKFRFYDKDDKTAYVDVGQLYTGGDDINFFSTYHSDKEKSDGTFTLKTNTKTSVSSAEFVLSIKGSDAVDVKVVVHAKPYSGEVDAAKPKNSIPIQKVLQAFGIDPEGSASL